MLPDALLARLRGARKVVELGAGARFGCAAALARALPGCQVLLTDVDPRVRGAPPPLRGEVDDLARPQRALYEGAALLYAVRLPEELHPPALRLARAVGAPLALRLLGDDAPAAGAAPDELLAGPEGPWLLWRAAP